MEQNSNQNVTKSPKKVSQVTSVRLKNQTSKKLSNFLAKCNKKDFGKRIKGDDVIALALKLLSDSHIKELQNSSLSNADILEIKYQEYIKKNGKTSKDEFYGVLLNGMNQQSA